MNEETFQRKLGELIAEIDSTRLEGAAPERLTERPDSYGPSPGLTEVRKDTAAALRAQVAGMNVSNFIVRPRRRWVSSARMRRSRWVSEAMPVWATLRRISSTAVWRSASC